MKTTKQILETESFQCMPDGFDVLINKKQYSEEEIIKALEHTSTFIWMNRDTKGRVTTLEVEEGLNEFKKILMKQVMNE